MPDSRSLCFALFPWRVRKRRTLAILRRESLLFFWFVSPYLLCKSNLDDTRLIPGHGVSPIPPGASEKGELLPYFAARTCFSFGLFRLFAPAGLLWAKHTLLYQQVNTGRHSLFRLICFVSRIWMIHAGSPTTSNRAGHPGIPPSLVVRLSVDDAICTIDLL